MSRIALGLAAAALIAPPPPTPATQVFQKQLDALIAAVDSLSAAVQSGRTTAAQRAFRSARTAYKRSEGLLAFYAPDAVVRLQGPLEQSDDAPPRAFNSPGAFPAVEAAIFPKISAADRSRTLGLIRSIHERAVVLKSVTGSLAIDESDVYDAGRAEIARVSTLDIAGFDSDREDDALLDAAAALDGVRETLIGPEGMETLPAVTARQRADSALREAAAYLRHHPTFEQMDRFAFVSRYSVPASHALAALRATQPASQETRPALWRHEVSSVYDSGSFDPQGYAGRYALTPTARRAVVDLGKRLFFDARLSGPGTRSCGGCHLPNKAFTDGLPKRTPLQPPLPGPSTDPPARHTPSLLNAAFQPAAFDDERVKNLEAQVVAVLANRDEMRSSVDTATRRVAADEGYRSAFSAAFGVPPERAVTSLALRVAIAAYVRSLTALNSPFDRAIRGDSTAISASARRGFTVFMGKARCGTCHFAPLFNGTQPPTYRSSDPEIIGVPSQVVLENGTIDPDSGVGGIDRAAIHNFAFKVPTVRNSALTAPYMHNGIYKTLDDVVDFYDAGGGVGIGIHLEHQTLFDQPLHLTSDEKKDVVEFLRALTDTVTLY
ncbi:MAG TPA: cytochrome c peroxidase [Gemmatimonadaceae bacterium]|nr:cytochrome c peroxidase [Gemmatimonadaceae bacterium]